MAKYPKWVTPIRKLHLAYILTEYLVTTRGWKIDLLTGELYNPDFDARINAIIADWKQFDREQDRADWLEERKWLHNLAERWQPIRGQFSSISKDIFFSEQPSFYLLGLGISGLTFKPFARVRLASSYLHLFIDLGDTLRGVSKNKKRKAIRYGKALPLEKQQELDRVCKLAVTHYLEH